MPTSLTGPSRTPDPIALAWGEELRRYREREELTQVDLAGQLAVHQTTVSQIERGSLIPSARLQRTIVRTCGLDAATVHRLVRGTA